MNHAIALRLFWKEYRVQRGLWLCMALGAFLLQGLVWLLDEHPNDAYGSFLAFSFLMPFFYAIGSGSVTFAVEREEDTHLRLVAMACPPGLTLFVKLVFGILATALLLAITVGSGLTLSTADLGVSEWSEAPHRVRWMLTAMIFTPMLGGLLWGMFFSLLYRKVLMALSAAAGAMIVSFLLIAPPGNWTGEFILRQETHESVAAVESIFVESLGQLAVIGAFGICLTAVNWMLASRWLRREFSDVAPARRKSLLRPFRFEWDGLDGGMMIEIGARQGANDDVLAAEQALQLPAPRIGLDRLYSHGARGLLRTIRYLWWKESVETRRLFLSAMAFGTLLAAVLAAANGLSGADPASGIALLCSAAALACGLMTFHTEQSGCSFRWSASHGISSAAIWLSKQLVWLTRLVISLLVLVTVASVISRGWFNESANMFLLGIPDNASPESDESHLFGVAAGRAVIAMLAFYSIGQVASLLFRRTVLAVFLGMIGCLMAFMWMLLNNSFDVAFSCAVLPMVPVLLLFTRLRAPGWLLEDNRPQRWLAPAASLLVGVAACLILMSLFRIYQIPAAVPVMGSYRLPDGTTGRAEYGLPQEWRRKTLAPVSPEEAKTAELYRRATEKLVGNSPGEDVTRFTTPVAWTELPEEVQQWTVANGEALQLARQAASRTECAFVAPGEATIYWSHLGFAQLRSLVTLAVLEAHRLEAEGDFEGALDVYRDALAMSRHAQGRGSPLEFSTCGHLFRMVNAGLVQWSSHSAVDQPLQARAAQLILDNRHAMRPLAVVNLVDYQTLRNTLNADPDEVLQGNEWYRTSWWYLTTARFPGADARNHRLLDWLEVDSAGVICSYVDKMSSSRPMLRGWYQSQFTRGSDESQRRLHRWLQTTPLVSLLYQPAHSLCRIDADCEADVRATLVLMKLLSEQNKSGELPADLDGVADASLSDPWTGRPFDWYPKGIPNEIHDTGLFIPKDIPFLFSSGSTQFYLQPQQVADDSHPGAAGGIGFPSGGRGMAGVMITPGPWRADQESAQELAESAPSPSEKVHYYLVGESSRDKTPLCHVWLLP